MAEMHPTTLEPTKLELLTGWLPAQRWYAGKSDLAEGDTPKLTHVGGFRLDDPEGEVGIEVLWVQDDSGPEPVLYQIPLTYRGAPLGFDDDDDAAATALVGTLEHGILGTRWVYDGTHDGAFASALVDLLVGRTQAQHRRISHTPEPIVAATTMGPAGHIRLGGHSVLRGEQSNTSLLCDLVDEAGNPLAPVMVKLFRVLSPGENPDVVLPAALSAAGSPHVPLVFGSLFASEVPGRAEDTEPEDDDAEEPPEPEGETPGYHLAFAQELIQDAEDAWRVAVRQACDNVNFVEEAGELGVATGQIHAALAAALGTTAPGRAECERIVADLRDRAETALAEVDALAGRADVRATVAAILDELAALDPQQWPALQRIHGDYHLGQVLRTPSGAWAAIDFEGEPLRPLPERSLPDLALRDVAGMLRSFDYAGGSAREVGADPEATADWVELVQEAFLAGYQLALAEAGDGGVVVVDNHVTQTLLRALLLDKALYEARYEARNRPDWLPIPLAAIDHLVEPPESGHLDQPPESGGDTHHNGGTDEAVPSPDERS